MSGDRTAAMTREGRILLAVALILMGLGLVVLYSASALTSAERHNDEFYFLRRQATWAAVAAAVLVVVSRTDYRRWIGWSPWLAAAAIALLVAVLIPGIGTAVNGARRWIRFGSVNLQVSEIARIAVLLLLVRLLCRRVEVRDDYLRGFLPIFCLPLLTAGLIGLEPDVGGALFTMAILTAVMVAGGVRLSHIGPTCAAAAGAMFILALTRLDYVMTRVNILRAQLFGGGGDVQGASYQLHQSLIALGSGGLLGEGLGCGVQKLRFLPEPHSDFILAILGEEMGFLGTGAVVGLFAILALVGCRIALRAPDPEGRLLAFGVSFMISLQAAINIGVVTGCLPTKGIPLPFVSYGGSSIVSLAVALGLLLSVSNRLEAPSPPPEEVSA